MKYKKVEPGEWMRPVKNYYKMMCCDCGLVHVFQFKHIPWGKGRKILLRAWRDNRATAARRRRKKATPV